MKEEACPLCRGAEADPELLREQVWEDDLWRLTVSYAGEVAGFAYLEPKQHIADITSLEGEEAATLGDVLARCARILKAATAAELVYVYVFGGGIAHLHLHLAPHHSGDALNTSMIRGDIVEEHLPSGATIQKSADFPLRAGGGDAPGDRGGSGASCRLGPMTWAGRLDPGCRTAAPSWTEMDAPRGWLGGGVQAVQIKEAGEQREEVHRTCMPEGAEPPTPSWTEMDATEERARAGRCWESTTPAVLAPLSLGTCPCPGGSGRTAGRGGPAARMGSGSSFRSPNYSSE